MNFRGRFRLTLNLQSLGGFVFALSEGTPYKGLQRTSYGGWIAVARYGQKPMSQNTGQQLENITVTGTWFQGDGMANLNALRALQNQRAPLVLADGYGNNLGQWTIKRLQEKQDKIIDDDMAFVLGLTIELNERQRIHRQSHRTRRQQSRVSVYCGG